MATNHGHENGEERNPSVEFDTSDLSARGIIIFFIVLAVFTVLINFGVLGMYVGMTRFSEKHDKELSPLAPKTVTPRAGILQNTANVNIQNFSEPRLLSDDTAAMAKLLGEETAALTAQPWVDAQGNVHLPIDQAIVAVASRLPVRAGSTALPNYPGAGSKYSYPSAVGDAASQQNEPAQGVAENSPVTK